VAVASDDLGGEVRDVADTLEHSVWIATALFSASSSHPAHECPRAGLTSSLLASAR
jgi:hypothetical protein